MRGNRTKLTWLDNAGNSHDLDYMLERGGSAEKVGRPVAFIELAWRRYTKHSRNKTGEIEGALLPLRDSYRSCLFLGVIVSGEYTQGGIRQLESHGIRVLHIPYERVIGAFRLKGLDLDYPEEAPPSLKRRLVSQLRRISKSELTEITAAFEEGIRDGLDQFLGSLEAAINRQLDAVIIIGAYGDPHTVKTIAEAVRFVQGFDTQGVPRSLRFLKFEIIVRYKDGTEIDARSLPTREAALQFLSQFTAE